MVCPKSKDNWFPIYGALEPLKEPYPKVIPIMDNFKIKQSYI